MAKKPLSVKSPELSPTALERQSSDWTRPNLSALLFFALLTALPTFVYQHVHVDELRTVVLSYAILGAIGIIMLLLHVFFS